MERFIPLCRAAGRNTKKRELLVELLSSHFHTPEKETRQFVIDHIAEDIPRSHLDYYASLFYDDPDSYMRERGWPTLTYPCCIGINDRGELVSISNNSNYEYCGPEYKLCLMQSLEWNKETQKVKPIHFR
jgi:hypothetical protein